MTKPVSIDTMPSHKNEPMIFKGVTAVKVPDSSPRKDFIVLNNIIATASLTMPSPKIKENSLGYSSYLMIEMAAITSEEQSKELTSMTSIGPM